MISIAGSFAEANQLTSFILLSVFVGDVTPRSEERAPAPCILIRTLTAHIGIVVGAVAIVGAHTHLQPIGGLCGDVGSHVIAFHLVGVEVHQVLTLVVVGANVEIGFARRTGDRKVVVLRGCGIVEDDASHIPVGIVAKFVIVVAINHFAISGLGVAMLFNPAIHTGLELFAIEIHTKQFRSQTFATVSVDKGLHLCGHIGIFRSASGLAPREVVFVRNLHTVNRLAGFGGHQNHTEGSASTVNGA